VSNAVMVVVSALSMCSQKVSVAPGEPVAIVICC